MQRRFWVGCSLLLCFTSFAVAQSVNIGAKGTEQVPGAVGVIGKPYTLHGTGSPLNFTLLGAAYQAEPVRLGENLYFPAAGEKLLVLRYLIQNPQKTDHKVFWSAFDFLAVDSTDTSCEAIKAATQVETGGPLGIVLKPGQKVEALRALRVAAAGEVPKLIVQRHSPPVLRYDLRGKVTPLPAPYADPADETGATLRDEVPATLKTPYATGVFTTSVEQLTSSGEALAGVKPKDGSLTIVTIKVTNVTLEQQPLNWSAFTPRLLLAADEEGKYAKVLIHAERDEKLTSARLLPGKTMQARWCFDCPAGATPQTLIVQERPSAGKPARRFVYTLSAPAASATE